jgi:hypothetical protein
MFLNPNTSRELARERQRDMLAQAAQDRLARQVKSHGRAAKLGPQPRPRLRPQPRQQLRRALRAAAALLRLAPEN